MENAIKKIIGMCEDFNIHLLTNQEDDRTLYKCINTALEILADCCEGFCYIYANDRGYITKLHICDTVHHITKEYAIHGEHYFAYMLDD